ncbi:unnamed protein product, partial [Urochloa humidicola]
DPAGEDGAMPEVRVAAAQAANHGVTKHHHAPPLLGSPRRRKALPRRCRRGPQRCSARRDAAGPHLATAGPHVAAAGPRLAAQQQLAAGPRRIAAQQQLVLRAAVVSPPRCWLLHAAFSPSRASAAAHESSAFLRL